LDWSSSGHGRGGFDSASVAADEFVDDGGGGTNRELNPIFFPQSESRI
jgi:hypothetical protein